MRTSPPIVALTALTLAWTACGESRVDYQREDAGVGSDGGVDPGAAPDGSPADTEDLDAPPAGDAAGSDEGVTPGADAAGDSAAVETIDGSGDAGPDGATVTGPSCETPRPFVPPGAQQGWRHTSTELFTVTQGSANHRGQDVIALEGASQVLIGKFAYGPFDKDLKDEDVEVFIQDDAPCGEWVSYGLLRTSEDGQHGDSFGITDDGGRIFLPIPEDRRRPVGWHPVRMLVLGDHSVAAFHLIVTRPATDAVVFDVDGTLTTDDFELVKDLFDDIFSGSYTPTMYEGGLDVTRAWARRDTLTVYLTARPDFLKRMTRLTLTDGAFPPGVLHLTDTTGQSVPGSGGTGQYKSAYLSGLVDSGAVRFVAAYGNADTDIQGYEAAGIDKAATFIIGSNGGVAGTVALSDYPSHLPTVEAGPPATEPVPPTPAW